MKSRRYRSSYRPRRRGLTQAQTDAIRRAFDAAPATVEGRFAKGQLVADGDRVWKVVSGGIRYHEDVSTALYGVAPARPPKEWKATVTLRAAIEKVLREGTHTPLSRGLRGGETGQEVPAGIEVARWEDGKPDSLASFPHLRVFDDNLILAVRPIYDDSPVVAWVRDRKLAKIVLEAIAVSPKAYFLPEAQVKERNA